MKSGIARSVMIVGGYGVSGTAMVRSFLRWRDCKVYTSSRRAAPQFLLDGQTPPEHIVADLLDATGTDHAFRDLSEITDLVYCAYADSASTTDLTSINVGMLKNSLSALQQAGARLQHVILLGGGKAYGPHLGHYKTPAKESDPRILGPIFYYDQEDFLKEWSAEHRVSFTVLRPDAIFGQSIGSPMNLVNGLAVYAAICRELGVPLRFPGSHAAWNALHQSTDGDLLGDAAVWAVQQRTSGEVYNVINGDQFRWSQIWQVLADFYDIEIAPPQPLNLSVQMADKEVVWSKMIERYGLVKTAWSDIVAWPFLDAVLNIGYDMVQSTIKIRKAGFHGCIDSHDSLRVHLERLRTAKLVP